MTEFNLAQLLTDAASTYPGRTAIVMGDQRLSYADVDAESNRVAQVLASRGVGRGDAVALLAPNVPAFTTTYFGILKAGATVVPLNVLLKRGEIAYHLEDSGARALVAFEGTSELPMAAEAHAAFSQIDSVRDLFVITADGRPESPLPETETLSAALAHTDGSFDTVRTDEDDIAVILYTSGTTGQPKGAELRHRNLRDNALTTRDLFAIDPDRPDTALAVLPLFHSFGQTVVQNGTLAFGGTIVMLPRFEPAAALQTMLHEKVTLFAGVPTMYWALLGVDDPTLDTSVLAANLRVAIAGGSALPVEIHREFESRYGVTIAEGYGLSETAPVASFSPWGEPVRPGSIGLPIPGVELTLLAPDSWEPLAWTADAVGEIAIRGHNVFAGYRGRSEATEEVLRNGWFRTGDLARRDADGWYYIVDRVKDLIIRGGFNVYPREIEELLLTHPAVSLAAVVGIPHESHGEEIKAIVVLHDDATASPQDLVDWARQNMAAYKYPRVVAITDALPMTATGKILKRELS